MIDPRISLLVTSDKDEIEGLTPAIIPLNGLLLHLSLFRGTYLVHKTVRFAVLSCSRRLSTGSDTLPGHSATQALLRLGHKVKAK